MFTDKDGHSIVGETPKAPKLLAPVHLRFAPIGWRNWPPTAVRTTQFCVQVRVRAGERSPHHTRACTALHHRLSNSADITATKQPQYNYDIWSKKNTERSTKLGLVEASLNYTYYKLNIFESLWIQRSVQCSFYIKSSLTDLMRKMCLKVFVFSNNFQTPASKFVNQYRFSFIRKYWTKNLWYFFSSHFHSSFSFVWTWNKQTSIL